MLWVGEVTCAHLIPSFFYCRCFRHCFRLPVGKSIVGLIIKNPRFPSSIELLTIPLLFLFLIRGGSSLEVRFSNLS